MNEALKKMFAALARECFKAGIPPQTAANVLGNAIVHEFNRTQLQAPGLVVRGK